MHSLCGRPTRSHTVPSPSPYILVARARATVSAAGLNVGRGCPGHERQHPASSRSTPTYVGPPLFPPLRGLLRCCCASLWALVDPGRCGAIYRIDANKRKFGWRVSLKMAIWNSDGLVDVSWRFLEGLLVAKSHLEDLFFINAIQDIDLMFANTACVTFAIILLPV